MSIAKPFNFVANTYAKASEVNADFDILYSQVNKNISAIAKNELDITTIGDEKANINGSSSQRFSVADPIGNGEAVNKQTMMKYIGNTLDYISGLTITKDSGSPEDTIIVSAGSCYDTTKQIILKLANDTSKQNTSQSPSSTYNVYITSDNDGVSTNILISQTDPTGSTKYRKIGYYTTDASGNVASIFSLSNTDTSFQYTSFVINETGLGGNVSTDLSSILPNDGCMYLIWVYQVEGATGNSAEGGISTDVFPYTTINKLDGDHDRHSNSVNCVCVPVGLGRWVYVNIYSTLRGYMKVGRIAQ